MLKYLSLMAELGQGPPPTSNSNTKGTSSFSPALPMLGATRPMLGLPAPSVSLFHMLKCFLASSFSLIPSNFYASPTMRMKAFCIWAVCVCVVVY